MQSSAIRNHNRISEFFWTCLFGNCGEKKKDKQVYAPTKCENAGGSTEKLSKQLPFHKLARHIARYFIHVFQTHTIVLRVTHDRVEAQGGYVSSPKYRTKKWGAEI